MSVRLLIGDCRERLRDLPDASVQCVVTSPPYFGLRDYGVDGQIGLEGTVGDYIEGLVAVFREVHRVLAHDGTLWLNLGDSYASNAGGGQGKNGRMADRSIVQARRGAARPHGTKPKDLLGIPWRAAFALQDDGWYLRQDIIWHKPNPMPESVRDRCTKAHEYLFLLSKSPQYYFDQAAIKEPVTGNAHARGDGVNPKSRSWKTPDGWDTSRGEGGHGSFHRKGREKGTIRPKQNESFSAAICGLVTERNKRSVWTVSTRLYAGAHFATFPPALIEPCVLAGSRIGDTVFDPFAGSGTTGYVADYLGRDAVLIDLNAEYADLIRERLESGGTLFSDLEVVL